MICLVGIILDYCIQSDTVPNREYINQYVYIAIVLHSSAKRDVKRVRNTR